MSGKERKRREREREKALGLRDLRLRTTDVERSLIHISALVAGYEDVTEYVLDLVRQDRDTSQQKVLDCPDCRGRGCFTCCSSEAEIRMRDKTGARR
jgi:hypothetical protein